MIRFGTYTKYKGFDFRLIKESSHFTIVFYGEIPPLEGFNKYSENVYSLNIPFKEITNAFFVNTLCIYNGFQFDANTMIDNKTLGIVTDSKEALDKLNLNVRERGVFQTEVKVDALEKLWEERSSSSYDLPMPDGLEAYKEINIV